MLHWLYVSVRDMSHIISYYFYGPRMITPSPSIISWHTTPYHTILHHTTQHRTTPYHIMSYYIALHHITTYHTILQLHHIAPHHTTSNHIPPHHTNMHPWITGHRRISRRRWETWKCRGNDLKLTYWTDPSRYVRHYDPYGHNSAIKKVLYFKEWTSPGWSWSLFYPSRWSIRLNFKRNFLPEDIYGFILLKYIYYVSITIIFFFKNSIYFV